MGNGAMAKGPQLPRPSSTLPERRLLRDNNTSGIGGKAGVGSARSKRRMTLHRASVLETGTVALLREVGPLLTEPHFSCNSSAVLGHFGVVLIEPRDRGP
jgi:hypothetical protein